MVESRLPKPLVAGSIPVSRSNFFQPPAPLAAICLVIPKLAAILSEKLSSLRQIMFWRIVAGVSLGLSLTSFSFAADATTCPAKIDVHQQLATSVSGWTPIADDSPHQLAGITFFDGPPKEKASLVYDDIKKAGGKQIATWTFSPDSSRQTWIACSYSGTSLQLTKALPAGTRSCVVTYDPREQIASLPSIEKITCK